MRLCFFVTPIIPLLVGCSAAKPLPATVSKSKSDPVSFFVGHTRSDGVIENRGGKPTQRITTETIGTWKDSILHIEQDLFPESGKKNHRSWNLRRVDATHLEATANDIYGSALGVLKGDEFSWTFRVKFLNRKFVRHLQMSQNFYLMPDGKTMIIRSVLRKFSFVVAQITEEFKKE